MLREMILTGQVAPGERLKVDGLKDLIGAGTAPIREALSLLTSDQLVERLDQRGFRAAPVSEAQFREILRLRCSLEDMALRESIACSDQQWEDDLVLALHRVNRADRAKITQFETAHKQFHMALLVRCQSPILLKFCEQLYDLNVRYRYLAGQSIKYQQRDIADEHEQIFSAAIEGDAEKASEALLLHYRTTGQFLAEQLSTHHLSILENAVLVTK
jgi:DNA-binding GntR family transcriptional regulator